MIDPAFTWGEDRRPNVPWQDTVIYEMHVKGYTMRHPEVPPQLRGTYAGLATAPVIEHLKRLGVTAVELLPVHAFVDDKRLVELGLRNYWGYNTHRLLRARDALLGHRHAGRIQDDGEDAALRRASKSYSTSSTTTPARATNSGPRSRSAASTTRPTTG